MFDIYVSKSPGLAPDELLCTVKRDVEGATRRPRKRRGLNTDRDKAAEFADSETDKKDEGHPQDKLSLTLGR